MKGISDMSIVGATAMLMGIRSSGLGMTVLNACKEVCLQLWEHKRLRDCHQRNECTWIEIGAYCAPIERGILGKKGTRLTE